MLIPTAMHFNLNAIILFAANMLLFFLCSLVNSRLAAFSLYLVLLGLMPIIPALYLRFPSFLFCSALSGLFVDAGLASGIGLFTCGFPVMGTLIRSIRLRFRSGSGYRLVLLANLTNISCIILLHFSYNLKQFFQPALWVQLLTITLFSQIMLHLVAPWFFRFEWMLFELFNLKLQSEDEFTAP